ncbi:MAG: hypothetical protein JNK87_09465 [Bryobacterales bacterium]|nr:hypothetical protein [Bryobacterales bacterium]
MLKLIRGLWIFSAIGALCALYVLAFHLGRADSSQQAECAVVAIALAVVPHCLARALEGASRSQRG